MKAPISAMPGRTTRKVREYGNDIRRLRSEGCTFEAIRTALADVGIRVSKSTVQREAARVGPLPSLTVPCPDLNTANQSNRPPTADVERDRSRTTTGSSGREIADAFFERNQFNELLYKDSR